MASCTSCGSENLGCIDCAQSEAGARIRQLKREILEKTEQVGKAKAAAHLLEEKSRAAMNEILDGRAATQFRETFGLAQDLREFLAEAEQW